MQASIRNLSLRAQCGSPLRIRVPHGQHHQGFGRPSLPAGVSAGSAVQVCKRPNFSSSTTALLGAPLCFDRLGAGDRQHGGRPGRQHVHFESHLPAKLGEGLSLPDSIDHLAAHLRGTMCCVVDAFCLQTDWSLLHANPLAPTESWPVRSADGVRGSSLQLVEQVRSLLAGPSQLPGLQGPASLQPVRPPARRSTSGEQPLSDSVTVPTFFANAWRTSVLAVAVATTMNTASHSGNGVLQGLFRIDSVPEADQVYCASAERARQGAAARAGSPCCGSGHPQPEAHRVLAAVHLRRWPHHRQGHPCRHSELMETHSSSMASWACAWLWSGSTQWSAQYTHSIQMLALG